jgi:hypothetical protein
MKTLSLLTLAAGAALVSTAATAQPPAPHGPPPGVTWHGGGNVTVRHHGGFHPGPGFPHRLRRGFVVHPFWFGPQFHINNWRTYGFADPGADGRWIRYYDDAYLIDRGGRVLDTREGLDWDEYGERWEMADGIPSYYGENDYRPGEADYTWAEQQGGWAQYGQYGYGAYGYGYPAYGYGYGYAYPIIIETTVTPAAYTEEVIEEVVEVRPRRHRRHVRRAPRPHCDCPAPRPARPTPPPAPPAPPPPAGERG